MIRKHQADKCAQDRERGTECGAGPWIRVGGGMQGLVSLDFIPSIMRDGRGL